MNVGVIAEMQGQTLPRSKERRPPPQRRPHERGRRIPAGRHKPACRSNEAPPGEVSRSTRSAPGGVQTPPGTGVYYASHTGGRSLGPCSAASRNKMKVYERRPCSMPATTLYTGRPPGRPSGVQGGACMCRTSRAKCDISGKERRSIGQADRSLERSAYVPAQSRVATSLSGASPMSIRSFVRCRR